MSRSTHLNETEIDRVGSRPDEGSTGFHADVVAQGETAYVFYFARPGRVAPVTDDGGIYATRRSFLPVVDGGLLCDRGEPVRLYLNPESRAVGATPPSVATDSKGT
ncbi:hypothetical protein OG381_44605 [Streptomyces sp. NBC_00490]|uniref:hypothetical protein n=1 Tax=Streptomyces sp. NBC_00490 TaxID=2903657 RepID=UPI002E178A22